MIATPVLPARPVTRTRALPPFEREESLRAARGIFNGLLLAIPLWGLIILAVLAFTARPAHGQVAIEVPLSNGAGTTFIRNSSRHTQQVTVALHHGHVATQADGARYVALEREVVALVAPAAFVLRPGESQIVRLKLREAVALGTTLRLVSTFTPLTDTTAVMIGARLVQVTRFIAKATVQ